MSVLCFIIHGIGTQDQAFSDPLQKGVHRKLEKLIRKKAADNPGKWANVKATELVDFETLYWANIESNEQNNLYRKIYPKLFGTESKLKKAWQFVTQLGGVRSLSIRLIGDVFGYLGKFQEPIKREVFTQLVDKLSRQLKAGKSFSIILVGHSLGSVILHDLISGFLRYRYAGFDSLVGRISVFTMGSPLSLFSLVAESADPRDFAKWVNFLHPRDPVAFPMRSIFPEVEDVELGKLSWNLLALHSVYWHDDTVHQRIAQEIVEHHDKDFVATFSSGPLGNIPPEIFQPFHGAAAQAGFSDYFADFQKVPFDDIIPAAKQIDVCNVYGRHWVQENVQYFIQALYKPETIVRVCMLSPESASLPGFSYQFSGMSQDELKKRIEEVHTEYLKIFKEAQRRQGKNGKTGRLQIYRALNIVNHGFYRFDDVIYFTPRQIASNKEAAIPIPTLVYRNTSQSNNFFSWLMRDFNFLITTDRDAVLYFDSATAIQPTAGKDSAV